ncbi:Dyp-type peroxidase [Bowmanella sp. Y26]|uniref:Dyp-type peroxidase n=1 Tax=Bowmanella yangjiangensis TaxID=2811230 RepID=UPI001BDDB35F|nr:Dyp-type peroxidase [Bowmanella yangjiangensis]MBT1062382.1 Dyp-type peroxidase [Bowmanella yangjiangensis]
MSQPQKGICAEPNLHALYLLFNVTDDDTGLIRRKLAKILDVFEHYDEEHYEAMVSGVVAVGSSYWMDLYPGLNPKELSPFPNLACEDRQAPVVPCDLFIQIRADRADICHAVGVEVYELLKDQAELVEQTKGFRYLDGRDLLGFVEGGNNPKGMKKLAVAIVGDDDPDFAGGSYVHVQRYRHDMDRWNRVNIAEQEVIIGRTKEDDVEFPLEDRVLYSHSTRTNLVATTGRPIEILRQSMPYGDMQNQGLFFVSCCKSPKPFMQILHSRIVGDRQGNYDRLLDYSVPETGAAFFAPSVQFIKKEARR